MKRTLRLLCAGLALALSTPALATPITESITPGAQVAASVTSNVAITEAQDAPHFAYHFVLVRADGTVEDLGTYRNVVTTQGRDDVLTQYFKGSAYTATWYIFPKDNAQAPSSAHTYSSRGSWAEVTAYSAGTRPTITFGTVSAQSLAATGATAFAINGTATIGGACIATGSSTKGDAAAGAGKVLYSCTDFAAPRSVASGDTLNVTPTVTD